MNFPGFGYVSDYLKKKPSRSVSIAVLIISIACINAWQLVLPNFSYDNSFNIAAAKNVYDGKGYTLATVSPGNLGVTNYAPVNQWPPGYSWLLMLVKKITQTDWISACYILNAMGASLLVLALRKILLLLGIPVSVVNLYLLFAGTIPYPFLGHWFSDLLAIAFFMWAYAFLLQLVTTNKNPFVCSVAAGILLGYCPWLKYLYLPVSLVPFIFLWVYAVKKDGRLVRPLLVGSIFLVVLIGFMLWFQQRHAGAPIYLNPTGHGFFPKNLLHLGPFIPGSTLDFPLFDLYLSALFHVPYPKMFYFWRALNVLLLAGIIGIAVRFYRRYGFSINRPLNLYMSMGVVVSVTIVMELVCLSLTQAPFRSRYTPFWTYVEELRYFSVALLLIPQGVLFLILYQQDLLNGFGKKIITVVLIVAAIQTVHGMYRLPKQVFWNKEVGKNRTSEKLDLLALKIVNQLLKSGERLVVCSGSVELSNITSLAGTPVLYPYDSLNGVLASSKPVTLLVVLSEKILPEYQTFFSYRHPKLIFTYRDSDLKNAGTNFYMVKFP